jgi:hypothetical protein
MPIGSQVPKLKGSLIIGLVKALRFRRADAETAVPAQLQHYLSERVLAGSWYPEEDYVGLCKVLARLMAGTPDAWATFGTVAARGVLDSVYRAMIIPGSPARTLLGVPRYWAHYHTTGRLEVTLDGDAAARIEIFDYASSSPEICRSIGAFYTEVLKTAGGREVRLVKQACRASGEPRCLWDARWLPPAPPT